MADADETFLRNFHRNLIDRPLEPDDPRYVSIYSGPTASSTDPVQRLARRIEWKPLQSTQLFSGFRGTGKSTELRRLRRTLTDRGFKVVLCDMTDYLNLSTPIDISDFLISAAGALSDSLAADGDLLGRDLGERGFWRRAADFLTRTEVAFDGLAVGASAGDVSAQLKLGLKDDPSFRERLQTQMRGRLGALANDVREFMADCVKAIQAKHGDDIRLVVLFDSIEQIRGSSINDSEVFASVETLFVGHPDKLRFDGMHVIYTVPPWLKIRSPGVSKYFDGSETLPCVKLREHTGEPAQAGFELLKQVVEQRGDWRRVFAPEDFELVLFETGGYLRDLFRVLSELMMHAADQNAMPLDRSAVEFELARLRADYLPISHEDCQWLARVALSHEAELPAHKDIPSLSRLFDNHLLLCYRNGEEWYDLHPLIRDEVGRITSKVLTKTEP